MTSDVVVAGAGLVGPVVAMYAARRLGSVTLVEQRTSAAVRGESRRSLMVIISARGWRALADLGLGDAARSIAVPLVGRCGHLPTGGNHVTTYSRGGDVIWAVSRRELSALLLDAARRTPGVDLRQGHRVVEVDLDEPGLVLADGSRIGGGLVLGCDGARSRVREAMMRRGARASVDTLPMAYQEVTLQPPCTTPGVMHYWPAGDGLFGAFPTAGGGEWAGSVFLRRDGDPPSFASAPGIDERVRQFVQVFPELADSVPDLAGQLGLAPVASVALVRSADWVWEDRAALLGDACHAMAPFMGQGMNCGFEDARVLVDCLMRSGDTGSALRDYEERRRPDADAIVEISLAHYRTMSQLPDARRDTIDLVKDRIVDCLPERFAPLYERCAFSEDSYAEVLADERLLSTLATGVVDGVGPGMAAGLAGSALRAYVDTVDTAVDTVVRRPMVAASAPR